MPSLPANMKVFSILFKSFREIEIFHSANSHENYSLPQIFCYFLYLEIICYFELVPDFFKINFLRIPVTLRLFTQF